MAAFHWELQEVWVMRTMLEHPEIAWIERTGYPSWMQEMDNDEDEDEEDFEPPETVWED